MTLEELLKHNAEVRARRKLEEEKKKEVEKKEVKKATTKKSKKNVKIELEDTTQEEQEPIRKFLVSAEEEAKINNQ